ncbi:hypothetical protein GpartN1_g5637.t1 [Galdieria partita]|uniref:Uncharacterized protein n=1 Tax=Galdieria partita TaxID=83374 RepID=A0A9C7Q1L5_9RHOD|nr:hypothetical protein GpartN1_g5637.t1 [Galdieria partita]
MTYQREKTLFVSSFTPCSHAKFLSSIRRVGLSTCQTPKQKRGHLVRMGADNLKFWKDFWCGGFPGGEAYLNEVIESDFAKPVPGLESTGLSAQRELNKTVPNKQQYSISQSSSKQSSPSSSNNGTANFSEDGQVRLVTDPVTGRSRLEIVPPEERLK